MALDIGSRQLDDLAGSAAIFTTIRFRRCSTTPARNWRMSCPCSSRASICLSRPPLSLGKQAGSELQERCLGNRAKGGLKVFVLDLHAAVRHRLVQKALRIAHAAFRGPGDHGKSLVGDRDAFGSGDRAEPVDDLVQSDPLEPVALAAGMDRGRDFLRFGRGEDKDHVRRRFFEGLQQGIEGLVREHVDFVDHIDLVLAAYGRILHGLAQLADMFDAAVRRAVDLNDIHRRYRPWSRGRNRICRRESASAPAVQFRALARMRAVVVLPTPRGPENRKAWASLPEVIAFWSVA